MTIEHKNITDPNIHEPKGAGTASADTVYTADGLGSGAWERPKIVGQESSSLGQIAVSDGAGGVVWKFYPEGFGFYKGNGAAQVFNTAYKKLLNNAGDSTTNTAYLPYEIRGVSQLWDSTSNKITPVAEGDSYQMRLDLPITGESGSPTEITVQIDIGTGASPTIPIVTKFSKVGRTVPYSLSVDIGLFAANTFFTNKGQIFVKTDVGTVTCTAPGILLTRTSAGNI